MVIIINVFWSAMVIWWIGTYLPNHTASYLRKTVIFEVATIRPSNLTLQNVMFLLPLFGLH